MPLFASVQSLLAEAGAEFISYGDPETENVVELAAGFGEYPGEYAAIRKGVGLWVSPHRAVLALTGSDRLEFLQRMLTQEVKTLVPGQVRRGMMLTEKGRILADLLVCHEADRTLLVLDRSEAGLIAEQLEGFLFTEDVQVENLADRLLVLTLAGPASWRLLSGVTGCGGDEPKPGTCGVLGGDAAGLTWWRFDQTGGMDLHLALPEATAADWVKRLSEPVGGLFPDIAPDIESTIPDLAGLRRSVVGRGVGWLAFNTARIEAGVPLFHVDYGPNSLPHETGLLSQAVSFTKGCYRGQEIVARMEHLGHPARKLAMLRFKTDLLPVAGSQVFAGKDGSEIIGAITSSTVSPLAGHQSLALAMMKWGFHQDKTVSLFAEDQWIEAQVGPLQSLIG